MLNKNEVAIGEKPILNYVNAVVTLFMLKGESTVLIKARGKNISRAVDVALISVSKFMDERVRIVETLISGSDMTTKNNEKAHVSEITIILMNVA